MKDELKKLYLKDSKLAAKVAKILGYKIKAKNAKIPNVLKAGTKLEDNEGNSIKITEIYIDSFKGLHPMVKISYNYKTKHGTSGKETNTVDGIKRMFKA